MQPAEDAAGYRRGKIDDMRLHSRSRGLSWLNKPLFTPHVYQ
ncbi:hypothetical protein HMPREF0454_04411 [Hafnia alvei ATCC 51873]|uniref:Uncharacterized protein n=1 Tax=Hafnia alvei ATCC 51873 TaxID=1002364 RepID=G9YCT3_HAFAL|nr:hypothetical protein HMPREF0454_04411 [Hafnia alvei ATCC 51873]